ncbi:unnamed protein product [Diamesa serratosioi]
MNFKCLIRHGPTYCTVMNQTYNDENEAIIFNTEDYTISDNDISTFHANDAGNNFSVFPNAIFEKFPYLESVDLYDVQLKTLNQKSLTNCLGLQALNLEKNLIEHLDAGVFEQCENLLSLNLVNNKISIIDKDAFRNLGSLEILYLRENSIAIIHPETFNYIPNLIVLFMNNNQITKLHDDTFKKLNTMWYLELSYNRIATIHSALFKDVPRLTTIRLGFNRINAIEPDFFEYWPSNSTKEGSIEFNKNFCVKKEFVRIGSEDNPVKSIIPEFTKCFRNYLKTNGTL